MDLSERTLQVLVGMKLGIGFVPKLLLTMQNICSIIGYKDWGGIVMDFKNMIIKLLDKIDDSRILRYIYIIISDIVKEIEK